VTRSKNRDRKKSGGKQAKRIQRPRLIVLAYAFFVLLVCGVFTVRHLRAPSEAPGPPPIWPDEVEARVIAVLESHQAQEIRRHSLRYGAGTRLLEAVLPDSASLTRLNLAVTESLDELPVEILEVRSAERGRALNLRVGKGGVAILELRARIQRPATEAAAPVPPGLPKVAIIIDDLGHNQRSVVLDLVDLDHRLTFGVLPGRPHSMALARLCYDEGREVILHQPMEPLGAADPGPFALTAALSVAEIGALVPANLARVPCAVGLNNHMGSKATADAPAMSALLDAIDDQGGLYFVDSATGRESVALALARARGLPASRASVFIDARDEPESISKSLTTLRKVAERRGHAIGIGHPRPNTYEVLATRLGELEGAVWNLVPASVVVGLERI